MFRFRYSERLMPVTTFQPIRPPVRWSSVDIVRASTYGW